MSSGKLLSIFRYFLKAEKCRSETPVCKVIIPSLLLREIEGDSYVSYFLYFFFLKSNTFCNANKKSFRSLTINIYVLLCQRAIVIFVLYVYWRHKSVCKKTTPAKSIIRRERLINLRFDGQGINTIKITNLNWNKYY